MTPVCEHCGEPLRGKRAHARYCDSTCRADATRVRTELREGGKKALKSAASHPLANARAAQEASELKSHWSQVIYQGIIDRLQRGAVHADDLEPLFPANETERAICRKLVGAQFGSLASRHYIHEVERRKSSVPSRKGAKSGVFEFTRLGREKLAGVSAGVPNPQGPGGAVSCSPVPSCASTDPGDSSRSPVGSEETPTGELPGLGAMPLFEEKHRPLNPLVDAEAA